MKYAVAKIGGSQFLVTEGQVIEVNKLKPKEGEEFAAKEVLLVVDGDKVVIGRPTVNQATIKARLITTTKGEKVRVSKFKAKTGYRRTTGFRPELSTIKIEKIVSH